ncbi:MAG: TIGR03435 family protein [Terriglobia bacterium]
MNPRKPACAAGLILLLSCCFANAQSFEVASIRRNLSGSQNTGIDLLPGGRIHAVNATLKTLIRNAYGILSFQLAGETGWIDSEYYNIEARTGAGESLSQEQLKPFLQSLLADRFQLKVHWETREENIYALTVDKSGLRMKENLEGKDPSMNTQKNSGRVRMKGVGVPMAMLASNLGNQVGRIVVDKTGLAGAWDFQGAWEIDPTPDSEAPSIFTGLREQLGLKLVPQRGPASMLVIDRVERPSEN